MAANFDRWEKDPFFSAAEEVQESADRMESTYRTWIHEKKLASTNCDLNEIRRDLQTALGTAKWQLEEFERAVKSSYVDSLAEDARTRHCQFIDAIGSQIATAENSLKETSGEEGKTTSLPWVRLDQGERDELAVFLSGFGGLNPVIVSSKDKGELDSQASREEAMPGCSSNSTEETKEDRLWTQEDSKCCGD
ncbi:hypothetical protein IFM89_026581 [Coptis chinensis]|uniref:Syntaxin 6/10/61 N-terminal domain-containing protein n=1 Tax=Coptis chinensis TaxID=261450 RepID=A0A835IU75_9MAGN|nr:hypothetical protein IFM89_026581 [Coptis chinensis]